MIDFHTAQVMVRAAGGCECTSHVTALRDALNEAVDGAVKERLDELAHPRVDVEPVPVVDPADPGVAYRAQVRGGPDDGKELAVVDGDRTALFLTVDFDGEVTIATSITRPQILDTLRKLVVQYERLCVVDSCEHDKGHAFIGLDNHGHFIHLGQGAALLQRGEQ